MVEETKYKIEQKRLGGIPGFLIRWETIGNGLSVDEIASRLKEDTHHRLIKLQHKNDSTVLSYQQTPNWSAEEYDAARNRSIFSDPVNLEEQILYRVTPSLGIDFQDRR